MKKITVIVAALSALALFAGCSGKGKKVETGKNLSVEIGPNPETIDPALNSAVDGGNMLLHNFECLLTVDKDGKTQPGQAESYDLSADGSVWTFHLRSDLKWSDGSKLDANDFVYSWKRVCDPVVAAPYAETVLGMVKGYDEAVAGNVDALAVSAPDANTFVVELAKPCPYFASLAAFATLSPVQKATIEKNGDSWATKAETYVSNGPFYVTDWVPNSHIKMSKNPYYWNKDAIKLDSITFVLMEDANAAYSAFSNGDVLLIKDVPTEEIPALRGTPEFNIDTILGTYYLSLNTTLDIFKNAKVREALSVAIDRKYVADTLMQGSYTPAVNFIGEGWVDADGTSFKANANGGKPYISESADIEKAKALLAEAGYPEGKGLPTISYSTNDAMYHKVVGEYLQQCWGEIGVKVEVDIMEWASFTPARRSGNFMAARNGWVGDYSDPSNMLELLVSTNGNNDGKYSNPAFDKAMEDSLTYDTQARKVALHKAEDILMADTACIPLAYYNDVWLQSSKLKGTWHSPYGYWYLMYADVE